MRKEKEEELRNYIEELKAKKIVLLNQRNRFLKISTYQCNLNDGRTLTREKLSKGSKKGDASIILPLTKENNVILTVQPRIFTRRTIGIALPAGYVDGDETHLEAAKRELQEETGYQSENFRELCGFYQDEGISEAFNKGFLARDCIKMSDQKLDKDEYIRCFECNIEELFELIERGYILDGGSELTIERAKKYLK